MLVFFYQNCMQSSFNGIELDLLVTWKGERCRILILIVFGGQEFKPKEKGRKQC